MGNLKLDSMMIGMVQTNCYFIIHRETKECFVIDPAAEADRIIRYIEENGYTLKGIFLTHGHFDHIMAANSLKEHFGVSVYASREESHILQDPDLNISSVLGRANYELVPDIELSDGEEFVMAGFKVRAILTPGHTAGSMCFFLYEEGVLFGGDTLFLESVGRTDFPTGNATVLEESIRNKLFVLNDDVIVYPGHGSYTTIGYEKKNNPFVS